MGDFIRYIFTEPHNLTLTSLESGMKEIDPAFSIVPDQAATNGGDLLLGGELFGEVEINQPTDQVFIEDIEDLRDQLTDIPAEDKAVVVRALKRATGMIAFQLSEDGHDNYQRLDSFWDWLFDRYPGLLQIDEEGYYSQSEQILTVE